MCVGVALTGGIISGSSLAFGIDVKAGWATTGVRAGVTIGWGMSGCRCIDAGVGAGEGIITGLSGLRTGV